MHSSVRVMHVWLTNLTKALSWVRILSGGARRRPSSTQQMSDLSEPSNCWCHKIWKTQKGMEVMTGEMESVWDCSNYSQHLTSIRGWPLTRFDNLQLCISWDVCEWLTHHQYYKTCNDQKMVPLPDGTPFSTAPGPTGPSTLPRPTATSTWITNKLSDTSITFNN